MSKYFIIENTVHGDMRVWRVTNKPTNGYILWNIGRENFPFQGYIPTAKPLPEYRIDITSIEALYVGDEGFALWLINKSIKRTVNLSDLDKLKEEYKASI